ncbi:MAG: hypothetical protein ACRD0K_03955 [Egibacteraceae bacterium]
MTERLSGFFVDGHARLSRGGRAAWLVIGSIDLLNGAASPRDSDVMVLVPLPCVEAQAPSNTIVVRWSELGAVELIASTVDGSRRGAAADSGAGLFAAMAAGNVLRRLITQVSGAGGVLESYVPLFYLSRSGQDLDLHVYSQIRFLPEDACFIRVTETPLRVRDVEGFSWLATAAELHAEKALFLNNHQCYYRKCFDGQELEYKYTLLPPPDIWSLTTDVYRRVRAGKLPGFMLEYHDEFQAWDYLNHLFEVTAPERDRGYVSFIPTTDGRHIVKRKWFTEDAFARRERLTAGAAVGGSLEGYLCDVLRVQARRLPSFRRVRYDVNIESVLTGHVFCILFDRCGLLDAPDIVLSQCEVEYVRSRTAVPPSESDVLREIDDLAWWLQAFLEEHELSSQRSCYSKLTFLREVVARRPDLGGC